MAEGCYGIQLVDKEGVFNVEGLENFTRNTTKLSQCGFSYAVVAIMGAQSSGKSTLLNYLFGTKFEEMDARRGRSQTTKGIWIAECAGMETFTIAMDLEGTDSRERGEDDTAFEKQSALLALATANIVLINMWCHDIGREHAANKPLLRTVFQVMMHLFSPRKTTLLFVIRDRTKTSLEHLELILMEDIQKVWAEVAKPEAHISTPLSELFDVEFAALSSYEEKEEQFKEQVDQLRQQISNSISPRSLPGDGEGVVPASGFCCSVQQIWRTIKENKNLDLPDHKVMVATVCCEEIAKEKLQLFTSDEDWVSMEKEVQAGPVSGFGKKVSSILGLYLLKYDEESIFFDEGVREEKRRLLELSALDVVYLAYVMMLRHLSSQTLERFKTSLKQSLSNGEGWAASAHTCTESCMLEFDKECEDAAIRQAGWDASEVREKLCHEIETHVSSVKNTVLSETLAKYENQLNDELTDPIESLFEVREKDTWADIRIHIRHRTGNAISKFSKTVDSFDLDGSTIDTMKQSLWDHARNLVERKAREEVGKVLFRMKDRFTTVFNYEKDSKPRDWTGKEDIITVKNVARSASLKILSVMAAMRLDGKPDNIEEVLFSSLMGEKSSKDRTTRVSMDPLASNTWEEVSPNATLLTPLQCKSLWKQFIKETEYEVTQAISLQEARKWIKSRSSILRTVAENAGAAAVGTATGVALVVVGVAAGLAGAVGGAVGLMTAAAAAAMR